MKKYLIKIDSRCGATMHIGLNSDNVKPVFVYYCGRDTGKRYVNIGSAARYLEKIAAAPAGQAVRGGRRSLAGRRGCRSRGGAGARAGCRGAGDPLTRKPPFCPFCKFCMTLPRTATRRPSLLTASFMM